MYNGLIIKQLLEKRRIKNYELTDYLNYKRDGANTALNQIINGNPTVKKLEPIADFFQVSMDIFFERNVSFTPYTNIIGNGNAIGNGNMVSGLPTNTEAEYKMKIESLEKLLEEKEKRIKTLEDLVSVLKDRDNI